MLFSFAGTATNEPSVLKTFVMVTDPIKSQPSLVFIGLHLSNIIFDIPLSLAKEFPREMSNSFDFVLNLESRFKWFPVADDFPNEQEYFVHIYLIIVPGARSLGLIILG